MPPPAPRSREGGGDELVNVRGRVVIGCTDGRCANCRRPIPRMETVALVTAVASPTTAEIEAMRERAKGLLRGLHFSEPQARRHLENLLSTAIATVAAEEREACAQLIQAEADDWCGQGSGDLTHWDVLKDLPAAIRARGK